MTIPSDKSTRPDEGDLPGFNQSPPPLMGGISPVESSTDWTAPADRERAFDRQMTAVMCDVEIPPGLRSRLLASLAAAAHEPAADEPAAGLSSPAPVSEPARRGVRNWQVMATAAALLLGATLTWSLWPDTKGLIALEQVRHPPPVSAEGAIDTSGLDAFDESFSVSLPDGAWSSRTEMAADLKGIDWNGDGQHDQAVYEFRVGGRVHGFLLILPAARLIDPPDRTRLSDAGIDYRPVVNTAWVDPESGLAYVCFIDRGDLPALQRVLFPHAA